MRSFKIPDGNPFSDKYLDASESPDYDPNPPLVPNRWKRTIAALCSIYPYVIFYGGVIAICIAGARIIKKALSGH